MCNVINEIYDELIEERLMQVLSRDGVLPYQELKTRAAASTDDRAVRRVLQAMIERGLVKQQADRKAMWYLGYAQAQSADRESCLDDVPAPFAQLLRELVWEEHPAQPV
jgi:hypothetical protein